jgi:alpha-glucosidase
MNLLQIDINDDFIEMHTDEAWIRMIFLSADIFRVRVSWNEKFLPDRSYILVKTAWEDELDEFMSSERIKVKPYAAHQEETAENVIFHTDSLEVRIKKAPFAISVYNKSGVCLHADVSEIAYGKDHLGRVYHYSVKHPDNCYYGYGEKTGFLNKDKRRLRMSSKDTIGYDPRQADPLYKHIPFYMVLNKENKTAHGIFYHNAYDSTFDIGAERSGYWTPYTYFVADGGEMDWFFFNGPTVKDVVANYTDITGKTVLPPRYSLGYMGSTMYYTELPEKSDEAVLGFIAQAKAEDIPCEGFFLSSGYTSGKDGKRYVFEWNQDRFPDPAEFVMNLQQNGAELCPNVKPGMLLSHPEYKKFAAASAYIKDSKKDQPRIDRFWGGPASFIDFTSPNGRQLWKDGLKKALISNGVVAIWNDNCEYETQDVMASCYGDGKQEPLGGLRPIMPTLMARMAYEAMAEAKPGVRPYILNRAGFAGIQRYASTWCGDNWTSWESLKFNVPTILGMGLSGVANQGSDICGFAGPRPEPELMVRWIQQGIFQPRFCIHSCNDDNTVTEPWMYPDYTPYVRKALKFRYTLVPYLYSLMYQASIDGAPIMRPMLYEFQNDSKVYEESFDYMFGPSMLVANVLEKGAITREVYLPEGTIWREWGTWRKFEGGQKITVEAPLDRIPLFIRGGSIIPTTEGITNLRTQEITQIKYLIEPTADGEFTMYEDDGYTNKYKDKEYRTTQIICTAKKEACSIEFIRSGEYQSTVKEEGIQIICPEKAPLEVQMNEQLIPRIMNVVDGKQGKDSWYYDAQAGVASISLSEQQKRISVEVLFASKDLISI